jgi:TonB-linked SusC/RagA family outer membrane protein
MRKLFLLACSLVFIIGQLLAQSRLITGTVSDPNGQPLFGASVTVKGTKTGTTTAQDGSFSLQVSSSAKTLVISAVSMAEQEVDITGTNSVIIQLKAEDKSLQEVVITGYTTVKKKEASSAISKITSDQIANTSVVDPNELLKGRVAGVVATASSGQPGSFQDVRIRGTNSISLSNSPLYVIDGIIVERGQFNDDVQGQSSDILANINPNDIESFNILKDASATALYGARGANGVIVISTKKGKAGKTEINLRTQYGRTLPNLGKYKLMNSKQYIQYEREVLAIAGYPQSVIDAFRPDSLANTNFNWVDAALVNGNTGNVNLSLNGGNENTKFYVSGGYGSQDGIVLASNLKKYSLISNITQKVNNGLNVGLNLNLNYSEAKNADAGNRFSSPILGFNTTPPIQKGYKADGTPYTGLEPDWKGFATDNFLWNTRLNSNVNQNFRILSKIYGDLKLTKWLKFSQTATIDWIDAKQKTFQDGRTNDGLSSNGYVYEADNQNKTYTLQSSVSGSYSINNEHNFDYLALYEYQYRDFSSFNAAGKSILANSKFKSLSASTVPSGQPGGTRSPLALISYVGQVTYNYHTKYFVTVNARSDGASQFTQNKRDQFFSVGGAWRIMEEDFMKNQRIISDLKLRGSYGTTGNISGLTDFEGYRLWSPVNYNDQPGIVPSQLGNDSLRWEKTKAADLGLEISFLKNRISLNVDVYRKNTDRQIFRTPITATSGFTTITRNIGSVRNEGLEIMLSTINVNNKDFRWNSEITFATNKNKVTALYNNQDVVGGATIIRVGESINAWYLREYAGADPANGDALWYKSDKTKQMIIILLCG